MSHKPMLVNYTLAHSDPGAGEGAVSLSGVSERTVCLAAFPAFRAVCEAAGFKVRTHGGSLHYKIRQIEKAIRAAQRDGRPWVSVSLHFNQAPLVLCSNPECYLPEADQDGEPVRRRIHAGTKCAHCGAPASVNWTFGHTCFYRRASRASQVLTDCVMREVDDLIPRSARKTLIRVPDPKRGRREWPNNVAWPRGVYRPAILVELGFACDPVFSGWIADRDHQADYGRAVAEGLIEFHRQWRHTPLADWHK